MSLGEKKMKQLFHSLIKFATTSNIYEYLSLTHSEKILTDNTQFVFYFQLSK